MTVQKTLKLTALGLGMASIALTGCKGKDGDNGVNGKSEKTTIPSVNEKSQIKTPDGTVLPHYVDSFETTGPNGERIRHKLGRDSKPEIVIRARGLPLNSCIPFDIVIKDINNKEVLLNNATAFYDNEGQNIGKKIIYNLDAESQKLASIKDNAICVLTGKELDEKYKNSGTRNMLLNKAAYVDKTVKITVEGPFERFDSKEIRIIDAEIISAYITKGDSIKNDGSLKNYKYEHDVILENKSHLISIPAGEKSASFAILGSVRENDKHTTQDSRHDFYTPLNKDGIKSIALYDELNNEIKDALIVV